MNRFSREIKAQGSKRFLKIKDRLFTWHHMAGGKGRELSEVLDWRDGTISIFPGYVRGTKHYGFPMLASAALDRKYAMHERNDWRRTKFIERAYESLRAASEIYPKPQLDPVNPPALARAA